MNRSDNFPFWTILIALVIVVWLLTAFAHILGLLLLIAFGGVVLWMMGLGDAVRGLMRDKPRPTTEGARWATLRELREQGWLDPTGWPLGLATFHGGFVQHMLYFPMSKQMQNFLLIGRTGEGKTANMVVPIVRSEAQLPLEKRRSCIVIDLKTDIYDKTHEELAKTHRIEVWNPSLVERSTCSLDPTQWIPADIDDPRFSASCEMAAQMVLSSLRMSNTETSDRMDVGDAYWITQPSSLLKGAILAAKAEKPGMTFTEIAEDLWHLEPEVLHGQMAKSEPKSAKLRAFIMGQLLKSDKTAVGVYTELVDKLAIFTDPRVVQAMDYRSLPPFDVKRFLAEPTILYLQCNGLSDMMAPLLSIVLAALTNQFMLRCNEPPHRLERDVRIIVDELAALGRIYRLATNMAVLRSFGVSHFLASQGRDALDALYGHHGLASLIANAVTVGMLGGTADDDAQWMSERLGQVISYQEVPSYSARGEKSYHYQKVATPLMSSEDIRQMEYEMVIDSSHIHPMRVTLVPYQDDQDA